MRNPEDYNAGWTTTYTDPLTGQQYSGAAARNKRLSELGGAQAVKVSGFTEGVAYMMPLIQEQQNLLAQYSEQLELYRRELGYIRRVRRTRN